MPHLSPEEIVKGKIVRHSKKPNLVGVLTGQRMSGYVETAEVRWGIETKYEALAILEILDIDEDSSFETLIQRNRYDRIDLLRSLMTFEKLNGSLSNVIYSMRTAEIDFFAHQFVPVLKFVNSPLSRLLIADEVGLGKTIEAGLIWTECRARYQARRLLVVCPPTLIPKWIRELRNRFSIEAEAVDATGLNRKFEEFKTAGASKSFALVTSYHAIRPRKQERDLLAPWLRYHNTDVDFTGNDTGNIKWKARPNFYRSLLEWEGRSSFLDLVVFDEAHLMKNTATANHLVGDILSSCSQSVLALSATPLTTKTRDLYALLKLVDPDMFHEQAVFNAMMRRNFPVVRLVRELQKSQINQERCLDLLEEIPDSAARNNLRQAIAETGKIEALPENRKMDLLGKANRLNELGSFLSRTRKVELNQKIAVREAVTLDVELAKEERILYNAVLALIRQRVSEAGNRLSIFHLIAPALAMTSCLPVMAQKLRTGNYHWGDMDELTALDSVYTENSADLDFVGEDQDNFQWNRDMLPEFDFEEGDTKYKALRKHLLARTLDEKIIIFAFFKDTLRYLERRLKKDGLDSIMVSGDIKDPTERDQLLQAFETGATRVLLCSEVVAEGVDLQFCRVLVNYDLPWNPMRVEQRIGRIDRIGQKADSIVIINFNVHGTIDGSIVTQLHEKIGLFEDHVGDLGEIMGDHVNKLTQELLIDQLSQEQTEERIRQAMAAIELEKSRIAEINEESDTLLGLRSYLQDSVRSSQSLGRYIKPAEIRLFTVEFFADCYQGQDSCTLNWDTPEDDCLSLTLSFSALKEFEVYLEKHALPWPRGFNRNTRIVEMTFDPGVHEHLRRNHRKLTLVNHIHPFVGWMIKAYQSRQKTWHPASAVQIQSDSFPSGIYIYLVMRVLLKHPALSKEELIFRTINVTTQQPLDLIASEALLNDVIEDGASWSDSPGFKDYSDSFQTAVNLVTDDCSRIQEAFAEELELRINTKRSQIKTHFNRQIEIQNRRLESMEDSNRARPQDITGTRTRITNLQVRLREELQTLETDTEVAPEFKRVACGIIKVSPLS